MAPIFETDQTHCYSEQGQIIPCTGTGQDAEVEKKDQVTVRLRFQAKKGLVKDTYTGALWSKDANPDQFPMTWDEAWTMVEDMNAQNVHGCSEWRLPSRRLLFSLISHQYINPALPQDYPFKNVFSGYYWTSDTCKRLENQAWYVHLGGGRVHRGMKYGSYLVWPVSFADPHHAVRDNRGGARYTTSDQTVLDRHTGLVWSQDASPLRRCLNWKEALSAIQRMNKEGLHGCSDWRLPNVRELESLVDLKVHSPALPQNAPFLNVRSGYWSSTTSVYEPRYAWTLYSRDGIIGVGYKPKADFHLWPVRSHREHL